MMFSLQITVWILVLDSTINCSWILARVCLNAELHLEPSLSRILSKARALTRRGSTNLLTFLMVLVGVITSNCFRYMSFGIRQTMMWSGAKRTTYNYHSSV